MTIGLTWRRTARRIKRLKEGVLTTSPDYSDRDPDFLALSLARTIERSAIGATSGLQKDSERSGLCMSRLRRNWLSSLSSSFNLEILFLFSIPMQPTPDLIHIGSLKSWIAPECVSINRLPMRATIYPFPSAQIARSLDRKKNPWFQLLNGQWQFKAVDRPENVALTDVAADCDRSSWDCVEVPGNWTLQGYGAPHYTNVQ